MTKSAPRTIYFYILSDGEMRLNPHSPSCGNELILNQYPSGVEVGTIVQYTYVDVLLAHHATLRPSAERGISYCIPTPLIIELTDREKKIK